jgi:hypothetical protein
MSRSAVDIDRCQDDLQEITMKQLIESGAAQIASGIQRVGASFDFLKLCHCRAAA